MRPLLLILAALIATLAATVMRGPTSAAAQGNSSPAALSEEHDAAVKGVNDALRRPWTDMCNDAARTQLAAALSTYFIGRSRIPKASWWPWAKSSVADRWDSDRDASVNLLTLESVQRGFVLITNLDERARPIVSDLVRGKAISRECERRPETWRLQEDREEAHRAYLRITAMSHLSQLWPETCPALSRTSLAHDLSSYFGSRSQEQSNAARWGELGSRFATAAWGTPADRTIESLTRKAAMQGLVKADAIRPDGRDLFLSVVKGTAPNARPCDKGTMTKN